MLSKKKTQIRARVFNADCWLEVRKVLRPANSIKVFRGPRANAELVPKFHVALYASHAALPMVTQKISP
jgi:hypothetical protein